MGSPKALLAAGSETFVDRLIGVLGIHCSPVVVVLGYNAAVIREGMLRAGQAEILINENPAAGQLSSLQCGLRAAGGADAVVFTPVDHPGFRPETIKSLIEIFERTRPTAVVPVYHGSRGHPVLCSRELAAEIAALPADAQARHAIHRPGTVYLDVDDPGVVQDIDDAAAYRAFIEAGVLK